MTQTISLEEAYGPKPVAPKVVSLADAYAPAGESAPAAPAPVQPVAAAPYQTPPNTVWKRSPWVSDESDAPAVIPPVAGAVKENVGGREYWRLRDGSLRNIIAPDPTPEQLQANLDQSIVNRDIQQKKYDQTVAEVAQSDQRAQAVKNRGVVGGVVDAVTGAVNDTGSNLKRMQIQTGFNLAAPVYKPFSPTANVKATEDYWRNKLQKPATPPPTSEENAKLPPDMRQGLGDVMEDGRVVDAGNQRTAKPTDNPQLVMDEYLYVQDTWPEDTPQAQKAKSQRLARLRSYSGFQAAFDESANEPLEKKREELAPKATTTGQHLADIGAGLESFLVQMAAIKKVVGPLAGKMADPLAWEITSQANGSKPTEGMGLSASLGLIQAIPVKGITGGVIKTLAEMGVFGGLAVTDGADTQEVLIQTLLPAAMKLPQAPAYIREYKAKLSAARTEAQQKAIIEEMALRNRQLLSEAQNNPQGIAVVEPPKVAERQAQAVEKPVEQPAPTTPAIEVTKTGSGNVTPKPVAEAPKVENNTSAQVNALKTALARAETAKQAEALSEALANVEAKKAAEPSNPVESPKPVSPEAPISSAGKPAETGKPVEATGSRGKVEQRQAEQAAEEAAAAEHQAWVNEQEAKAVARSNADPAPPVSSPKEAVKPEQAKASTPSAEDEAFIRGRWDGGKLGVRAGWVMRAGWFSASGKMTRTGEKIAEGKWDGLSPAAKNILRKLIAEDYGRRATAPSPPPVAPAEPLGNSEQLPGKQPWEMTRGEFDDAYYKESGTRFNVRGQQANRLVLDKVFHESSHYRNKIEWTLQEINQAKSDLKGRRIIKGVSKPTREQQAAIDLLEKIAPSRDAMRETMVQQAVYSGKPVPRSVLEGYRGQKWSDDALAKLGSEAKAEVPLSLRTDAFNRALESIDRGERPIVGAKQQGLTKEQIGFLNARGAKAEAPKAEPIAPKETQRSSFVRTTPAKGTPEREAMDNAYIVANAGHKQANEVYSALQKEIPRRGTKKYKEWEDKASQQSMYIRKYRQEIEPLRSKKFLAEIEDAAQSPRDELQRVAAESYSLDASVGENGKTTAQTKQSKMLWEEAQAIVHDEAIRQGATPEQARQMATDIAAEAMSSPLSADYALVPRVKSTLAKYRFSEEMGKAKEELRSLTDLTKDYQGSSEFSRKLDRVEVGSESEIPQIMAEARKANDIAKEANRAENERKAAEEAESKRLTAEAQARLKEAQGKDLTFEPSGEMSFEEMPKRVEKALGREMNEDEKVFVMQAAARGIQPPATVGGDVLILVRDSSYFKKAARDNAASALVDMAGVQISKADKITSPKVALNDKAVLDAAITHASTANSHYAISGIFKTADGTLVATDGHRMLVLDGTSAAAKKFKAKEGLYSWDGKTYSTLEGNFPRYTDVIPKEPEYRPAMSAADAAQLSANIKATIQTNRLGKGAGDGLVVEVENGNKANIYLNADFFKQAIDAMLKLGAKEIKLGTEAHNKPVMIEGGVGRVVIMPVDGENVGKRAVSLSKLGKPSSVTPEPGKIETGKFTPDPTETVDAPPGKRGGFVSLGGEAKPVTEKPWLSQDKVDSPDAQVQDFFGRTSKLGTVRQKLGSAIQAVREGLRERFVFAPKLPSTPEAALARDIIRTMPEARAKAVTKAVKDVQNILDGDGSRKALDKAGLDLLRRKVFVEDLIHDAETGKAISGGLTKEQLLSEQARLDALVEKVPSVKDALEKRTALWAEVSADLARRGVISEEAAKNGAYVRHFVLEHMGDKAISGPTRKQLKAPFRGYAQKRKGTVKDIATDYLEVELKALSDIRRDNAIQDAAEQIAKQYAVAEAQPGYTEWQFKRGNIMFQAKTITDAKIASMVEGALTDPTVAKNAKIPVSAMRDGLVIGGKQKTYIIPEWLAAQLEDLPVKSRMGKIASFVTPAVQWWKRWILRTNPIRYNLRNTLGDSERVNAAGRTGAFLRVPEAVELLAGKGDRAIAEQAEALGVYNNSLWHELGGARNLPEFQRYKEIRDASSFKMVMGVAGVPLRLVKAVGGGIQKATQFREDILRMSVFLDALKSVEKHLADGTPIRHWAGSKADIEALAKVDKYRAAAKISRETLGDYGNFTPWENDKLRNNLMPFYSWLKINSTFWPAAVKNAVKEGSYKTAGRSVAFIGGKAVWSLGKWTARFSAAYAALYAWNNWLWQDEETKRQEESLSPIDKARPHLTLKDGVISVPSASSDFAEWFGLQDHILDMQRYEKGQIDFGELSRRAMVNSSKAPVNKVVQSLSPYIKMPVEMMGLNTYPDVFAAKPFAKAFSDKAVQRTVLDILGSDVKMFYELDPEKRTLGEVLSFYFSGSSYKSRDPQKLIDQLQERLGKSTYKTDIKEIPGERQGHKKDDPHVGKERYVDMLRNQLGALGGKFKQPEPTKKPSIKKY